MRGKGEIGDDGTYMMPAKAARDARVVNFIVKADS